MEFDNFKKNFELGQESVTLFKPHELSFRDVDEGMGSHPHLFPLHCIQGVPLWLWAILTLEISRKY